jgi:hypothetical protein
MLGEQSKREEDNSRRMRIEFCFVDLVEFGLGTLMRASDADVVEVPTLLILR